MLPADFPNWNKRLLLLFKLEKAFIIEQIHEALVEKRRKLKGKDEDPTLGIIDAQSVKNKLVSSESKVLMPAKK